MVSPSEFSELSSDFGHADYLYEDPSEPAAEQDYQEPSNEQDHRETLTEEDHQEDQNAWEWNDDAGALGGGDLEPLPEVTTEREGQHEDHDDALAWGDADETLANNSSSINQDEDREMKQVKMLQIYVISSFPEALLELILPPLQGAAALGEQVYVKLTSFLGGMFRTDNGRFFFLSCHIQDREEHGIGCRGPLQAS